jgi:hypothetical protein
MHARGVRTLFLETGNWRISARLYRKNMLDRYVDAAHGRGMKVVAWYVPDFRDFSRDLRRALAAIRLETPNGERFDSFGLDIESAEVRDPDLRTARVLRLSTEIREAVGPSYTLAAIVPSPYAMGLIPAYWPGFPFQRLAGLFDVFVPMGYFTFRTDGPAQTAGYTRATLDLLAAKTGGMPIHAIGGLAEDTTGAEVGAFVRSALRGGVIGASLYDFGTMGQEDWTALAPLQALAPKPPRPPKAPAPKPKAEPAKEIWISLNRSHFLAR